VSGRKLAGILLEQAGPAGNTFVLGIGINVNQDADEFPSGLRLPATSIALELGRKVCMVEVLRNVTLSLDFHWQAFDLASASAKMNALCFTIGRHVEAITPRGLIQGTALSITPEGALVILTDSGRQEAVFSGEVRELKFS
jgi:BirA family biotin operon repressor/biotin-[acetyl-CoA-carboxylase] ligase